ncbi:phage tail sheath subtilisin-like domain-containing protein [Kitasatospora sp. NPDC101235]|uniref:phage tail sheath subtilisin-like domain-containing protein n=1 Tax=Kitasatospora sp. NPDC101235 TaxID=3364101 RepID=UPI0037FEFDB8
MANCLPAIVLVRRHAPRGLIGGNVGRVRLAVSGVDGTARTVPSSGHIAGVWARTDAERGVFKAPANQGVRGVTVPEKTLTDDENGGLNGAGVELPAGLPGRGLLVWGVRTLSMSRDWQYLNVRRGSGGGQVVCCACHAVPGAVRAAGLAVRSRTQAPDRCHARRSHADRGGPRRVRGARRPEPARLRCADGRQGRPFRPAVHGDPRRTGLPAVVGPPHLAGPRGPVHGHARQPGGRPVGSQR